jgi:acyl-CoA reductase-like NAD-dependent aldehyde dehydrogenase
MKLFKDAGLPDGVINFVPGDPELVTNFCITHPDFAGIHYTGSTEVFRYFLSCSLFLTFFCRHYEFVSRMLSHFQIRK